MFKFAIRFHDETSTEGDLGLGEVRGALPVAGRLVQNACEKGHPGLGVVLGAARVAGELVQNAACAKGAGTAVGHQPCRMDMAVDIVALFRQAFGVQVGLNERTRHGPERDKGQRVAEAIGLLCESFIEWAPRLDEEEMELYLAKAQGVLAGRVAEAAKDSNGREDERQRQVRSWHPPPAGLLTISWNLRAHNWLSRPLRALMHVEEDGQTLSPTAVPPRTGAGRACRLLRRWAGDRGGRSRGRMGQGGHRRLPVLGALRSARAEGDGRARLVCGCGAWGWRTLGSVGSVGRSYLGGRGACPQLPVGGGLCCQWCCLALLSGGRARLIGAA